MPNKFNREANYYQDLTAAKKPVSAKQLDTEFNYLVDGLNTTWEAVEAAEVGILPGANSPDNRGKVVVAQGNEENPIAFIQIGNEQIQNKSIGLEKLNTPANHGVIATKADGALTILKGDDRQVLQFKGNNAPVSINPVQLFEGSNLSNTVLRSNGKFEKVQSDDLSPKLVKIAHLADDIPLTKFVGGQANQLPVAQGGGAITWGAVPLAAIPNLTADKIPALSANKITTDTLDPARIPNISGTKITDNTIPAGKLAEDAVATKNIQDYAVTPKEISSLGVGDGLVLTSKGNNLSNECEWRAVPSVGQDQVLWGYLLIRDAEIKKAKGVEMFMTPPQLNGVLQFKLLNFPDNNYYPFFIATGDNTVWVVRNPNQPQLYPWASYAFGNTGGTGSFYNYNLAIYAIPK